MASQITATLPTLNFPREVDYPTQEDWAAFSAAAELNFGILGGDWSTQMQNWKNQANAMSIELNNNATIAQGLANYQGDWTSQGYTLGQTVSIGQVYYICKLTHSTGQNPTDIDSLYWNLALGNWNLKVDTNMSGYTSKTTPVDADLIPLSDSASSFGIKKLSWANLKATLKTYFDSLYMSLTGNQTVNGDKSYTGKVLVTSGLGVIGYGTGSGGIVTQLTNRVTPVTLNKPCGSVVLASGAGTTSWNSFLVNNNLVAENDIIVLSVKSGAVNSYEVMPLAIGSGLFYIWYRTTGGTAIDTVTVSFSIIKGANS